MNLQQVVNQSDQASMPRPDSRGCSRLHHPAARGARGFSGSRGAARRGAGRDRGGDRGARRRGWPAGLWAHKVCGDGGQPRRAKAGQDLRSILVRVLGAANKPMGIPELAAAAKKAGYAKSSATFPRMVGMRLSGDKRFRRAGRGCKGYRASPIGLLGWQHCVQTDRTICDPNPLESSVSRAGGYRSRRGWAATRAKGVGA